MYYSSIYILYYRYFIELLPTMLFSKLFTDLLLCCYGDQELENMKEANHRLSMENQHLRDQLINRSPRR